MILTSLQQFWLDLLLHAFLMLLQKYPHDIVQSSVTTQEKNMQDV